jgi:drug/metabolite transporter (DMT)-like permease
MQNSSARTGAAMLLFATASWGTLFHVGKTIIGEIDPWWFTLLRYAGATALLLAVLAVTGALRWPLLRTHGRALMFYGVAGYGFFSILVFIGLAHSLPSHGAVIMATMPVTSLVLRSVLDGQRSERWMWPVAALALAGVAVISGVWKESAGLSTWQGDLTVLLGTLGWVTYSRGQARLPQLTVMEYSAFTSVLALPVLALGAVAASAAGVAHVPQGSTLLGLAPALLYTIAIPTLAAALAFNRGVRELGQAKGILFMNMVPVSALVISVLRGQTPGAADFAGAAMVIAALMLQFAFIAAGNRRRQREAAESGCCPKGSAA